MPFIGVFHPLDLGVVGPEGIAHFFTMHQGHALVLAAIGHEQRALDAGGLVQGRVRPQHVGILDRITADGDELPAAGGMTAVHTPGHTAGHLAYLGDAVIGARSNIGAGAITCNYDGANKYQTTIGEDVFIGSNNSLIAPVTIGDGSNTAAGSTINQDVDKSQLAVARARQRNIDGWKRPVKIKKT